MARYAERLGIHPAIVAGRARREQSSRRMLWSLAGKGEVRRQFEAFEAGAA